MLMEAALSQRSICTKTVFISLREPYPRAHHNRRCSNNLWDSSTRKEKEFATLRLTLTHTRLPHVCRDDCCWVCVEDENFSCISFAREGKHAVQIMSGACFRDDFCGCCQFAGVGPSFSRQLRHRYVYRYRRCG